MFVSAMAVSSLQLRMGRRLGGCLRLNETPLLSSQGIRKDDEKFERERPNLFVNGGMRSGLSWIGEQSTVTDHCPIREADLSEAVALAGLINRAFEVERFFLHGDRTNPEEVRELFAKGHFLVAGNRADLAGCVYVEKRGVRAYLGLLSIETPIAAFRSWPASYRSC
jgi:hypothetical protein